MNPNLVLIVTLEAYKSSKQLFQEDLLHQCFRSTKELYQYDQTWASEGGRRRGSSHPLHFEIISKKRLFFQFRGVKTKFHHFWPPLENILGKSPTGPPWKNPSDAHVIRNLIILAQFCVLRIQWHKKLNVFAHLSSNVKILKGGFKPLSEKSCVKK